MTTQKEIDRLVEAFSKGELSETLLRVELELLVARAQKEQMLQDYRTLRGKE